MACASETDGIGRRVEEVKSKKSDCRSENNAPHVRVYASVRGFLVSFEASSLFLLQKISQSRYFCRYRCVERWIYVRCKERGMV